MVHERNHDYHILNPSIWPFMGAVSGFVMLFGAVLWFRDITPFVALIGLAGVLYVMYAWWADVVSEAHEGDHTPIVAIGVSALSRSVKTVRSSSRTINTQSPHARASGGIWASAAKYVAPVGSTYCTVIGPRNSIRDRPSGAWSSSGVGAGTM